MDTQEILILTNAIILIITFVAVSRSLHDLLKLRNLKFAFAFKRRYTIAGALVALMITGVYGATLFQHSFPATPPGGSQVIGSSCTTLTLETAGMITGFSEEMLFNCGATTPAITSGAGGTSTPTFTLPAGATSLSLVNHVNNAIICSGGSSLTSGVAHTFASGDSLDYCLASSSYPSNGIASFTVTWSQ
jgi:hypothetical protein